ncbi:MAG: hypothetical protein KDD99_12085, partial [Bacteroidetes bacterium]|nr:hypothetical protein [Bacteroidota bacterium]
MLKKILTNGFFICWFALLHGQTGKIGFPPIYNYSKKDYQAETQNWSVKQDERGIIYFGNNLGLLEFDGKNWACYPLANKSIIRSIDIDSTGLIYVGGQDELGFFQAGINGRLEYHSLLSHLPPNFQRFDDIWKVLITPGEIFWGTYKAIFVQKGDSFEIVQTQTRFENLFLINDQIYVNEAQAGIKIWDKNGLTLIPHGDFFEDKLVTSMINHPHGGMLIVTRASGIFHYQDGEITPWGNFASSYLAQNRTYCGIRLKNGDFAIGTSYNGIIIIDSLGNPVRIINKERGILNNSVLSMFEDESGGLWLGLENGISYVEIQSPFSFVDSREGIQGSGYSSIVYGDNLYMATNQGIYFKKWLNLPQTLISPQFAEVANSKSPTWTLANIDEVLLTGQHLGAGWIDVSELKRLYSQTGVWKFLHLKRYPDLMLVGTYEGLLLFEKTQDGTSWRFKHKIEGIDLSCRIMEEDE